MKNYMHIYILFVLLQFPSLRVYFKYLPFLILIPLLLVAFLVLYLAILSRPPRYRSLLCVILMLLLFFAWFGYSYADALKVQGRGSDQDDALLLAGERLLNGQYPYAKNTYLNNPISTGAGWVILYLPLLPIYPLVNVLLSFAVALILKRSEDANSLLLLLFTTPAVLETTAQGSDFLAIGCAFTLCVYAVYCEKYSLAGLAVLIGLVATSRVIFLYLIPILVFLLVKRSIKQGILFGVIAGTTAITIHVLFWLWQPTRYTPLHVMGKGTSLLGNEIVLAVLVFALCLSYALALSRNTLHSWLFVLWVSIAVPMFIISIAQLRLTQYNLADWEGANYIMVAIPPFLCYLFLSRNTQYLSNSEFIPSE